MDGALERALANATRSVSCQGRAPASLDTTSSG